MSDCSISIQFAVSNYRSYVKKGKVWSGCCKFGSVLQCHRFLFGIGVSVSFFSRTRRRAAYQYIKKKKGWQHSVTSTPVVCWQKPRQQPSTHSHTIELQKEQKNRTQTKPANLPCWQLGKDVSQSSSPCQLPHMSLLQDRS